VRSMNGFMGKRKRLGKCSRRSFVLLSRGDSLSSNES
jgi:hypothetical protein